MLRHPSYKGLRDDKPAEQVVREVAQEPPPPEPPRKVKRTNVDKVLFPATGFTKGELISYYERIGEVILPHLHGRLVSVKRYPSGVEGKKWWERDHRIDDLPTLLEFANKAAIELHPVLAFADAPERPTFLVFDLDPGPPAGIELCCKVALRPARHVLPARARELRQDVRRQGHAGVRAAQHGRHLRADEAVRQGGRRDDGAGHAGRWSSHGMTKTLRKGKVLVDWGQNDQQQVDGLRLLAARQGAADGVDAGRLGRAGRPGRARFRVE